VTLSLVPETPKPGPDRLRCPKHGIQVNTMTVNSVAFTNKDGRIDRRTGTKREVCLQCLFESGGTEVTEVGR